MSRIVYMMSVSLDGFVEAKGGAIDWTAPSEELHRAFNDRLRGAGAFLYGRRMYETMVAYWPTADRAPGVPEPIADFARIWRSTPKVAFSTTLAKTEQDVRLERAVTPEAIAGLRREHDGRDLFVGGAGLAASFLRLGAIDEHWMFVVPVVLGGGTPYFPPLEAPLDLRLVETRAFGGRTVLLRYAR